MMNQEEQKKYWSNFYKNNGAVDTPSPFAMTVAHQLGGARVIELGCGNGRDAQFLSRFAKEYIAVDIVDTSIDELNRKNKNEYLKFVAADFTNLPDMGKFDVVYSRFTMHSITEKQETAVIDWVRSSLVDRGLFFIEARGLKNEIYGLGTPAAEPHAFIYDDHFRRFIDTKHLMQKFNSGFEVKSFAETTGFAPYKSTDYTFFRLLAERQHVR